MPISEIAEQADLIIEKDKMAMRADRNKLYRHCLALTNKPAFNHMVNFSIVLNTVILAMDRYNLEKAIKIVYECANMVFAMIFIVEMVIKMLGFGCTSYFKDPLNKMDFSIVMLSILDLFIFLYRQYMIANYEFDDKSKIAVWG